MQPGSLESTEKFNKALGVEFDADLYKRTLLRAAADKPDFYILSGDDFSVDTLNPDTINAAQVRERYTLQRPYLNLIGRTSPLFLVNGNHEQAARYLLDGTPNNVAVWAQNSRNSLYSQPAPDSFYSGNTELIPYIGLLRNYFSWTWGDALFVVIDPYWESPIAVDNQFGGTTKRQSMWDVTHGDAQYAWLKRTLEQSKAKYKFVFAHHVMGTGRGGIELAKLWEWGGESQNGQFEFVTQRPSWTTPIHQLMVANKVSIFFQGHDHIWVRQKLDGVTFQTLSQPADPNYSHFVGEKVLTDLQIATIQRWVEQGAPEGGSNYTYRAPELYRSSIRKPDLVIPFDTVALHEGDLDRFFISKAQVKLDRKRYVSALELVPASMGLIHHANGHLLLYAEGTKSGGQGTVGKIETT